IKYSPEDSEVKLDLRCHPDRVEFHIQDQGIGLPKQDLSKLFTPFHRGINVGRIQGTGLGLSIVKKCVDAHQGIISVETEVGIGTQFTVTLYADQS
ncbi:MAG TPA: ATP-binding protein, partial [Crinalium sp.]